MLGRDPDNVVLIPIEKGRDRAASRHGGATRHAVPILFNGDGDAAMHPMIVAAGIRFAD